MLLRDGRTFVGTKSDYEGFLTRPMSWERARQKFERLAESTIEAEPATELVGAVAELDELETRDLSALLERVGARETTKGAVR